MTRAERGFARCPVQWLHSYAALLDQGIKFYDPEIVGDTPETVELVGVRNLVAASSEHLGCIVHTCWRNSHTSRNFVKPLALVTFASSAQSSLRNYRPGVTSSFTVPT